MADTTLPIITIGHDGRTLPEFITLLAEQGVQFVIDVRPQPYSATQPEFGRETLAAQLPHHDVRYVYMGDAFRAPPTDPIHQHTLQRLHKAHSQGWRVALLGQPALPQDCPRGQTIGRALAQQGLPVWHMDPDNALHPQEAISQRATTPRPTAEHYLHHVFGYTSFRPLQAAIIANAVAGRDTLAIMPTGSGKSLCYQIPALLLDGLTVVVSPLIALMQDQVQQLHALGVSAAYLNSSLDMDQYEQTVQAVRHGRLKLLYAAPETLVQPRILDLLASTPPAGIVIDEAHCISQWGHDFRPEYRQLAAVRQRFPSAVCMAFTATATPRVQHDIKQTLNFRDENEFLASFDRPNLHLEVLPKADGISQTLTFVRQRPEESGIIYCATRKQVDAIAAALQHAKLSALPYHAGLPTAERTANQHAFIYGETNIMVATVAFGMGINKPDVRYVLHVDLPQDIEGYYQQIGRAGRDGQPATCRLLFSLGDVYTQRFLISQGDETERPGRTQRLDEMLQWAQSTTCRRQALLGYFGEKTAEATCNGCDNCLQTADSLADLTVAAQKFLSCVKRTGGRFGANHIIQILRGSRAQNIIKWGHDTLSTYNIGGEYNQQEWQFLAQQFVQMGLLAPHPEHQTLSLTAEGEAVLKGQAVNGRLPHQAEIAPTRPELSLPPSHVDLLDQLRRKRKALADEAGYPPYVIFHDRTLLEMAAYLPQTLDSLGRLHGVGQNKLQQYGEPFLGLIRRYCAANDLSEQAYNQPTAVPTPPRSSARGLNIAQAFAAGQSMASLSAQYSIKPQTILGHLADYVKAGNPLPAAQLQAETTLTPDQQAEVMAAFAKHGTDYLRPIYDALEGTVEYEELHLWRMIYKMS